MGDPQGQGRWRPRSGESVINKSEGTTQAIDKSVKFAHKVKHYGAFGEDYLGYSDPTKDLRKAVKQKEKAAKKARKAKKKKTGKKEDDLFDPENLAKFKAELEEKRRLAAEVSPAGGDSHSDVGDRSGAEPAEAGGQKAEGSGNDSDVEDPKQKFSLDLK